MYAITYHKSHGAKPLWITGPSRARAIFPPPPLQIRHPPPMLRLETSPLAAESPAMRFALAAALFAGGPILALSIGAAVFAALAGIRQPFNLRVGGQGDWQAWDGRFDADLAGTPFARFALAARGGAFGVVGPARIGRLFSGVTAGLLGPVTQFRLAGVLDQRRQALDPIAVVAVQRAVDHAHLGMVDVAADHAVHAAPACLARDRSFVDSYIAAYYYDNEADLLDWIAKNRHQYALHHVRAGAPPAAVVGVQGHERIVAAGIAHNPAP